MRPAASATPGPMAAGTRSARPARRGGFTRLELAAGITVAVLLAAASQRAVLQSRETARRQSCADHLRQLHLGMSAYHDAHGVLPPAAIWDNPPAETGAAWPRRDDLAAAARQNWLQLLLPWLGEQQLADSIDSAAPIGAPANAAIRIAAPAWTRCASDVFHNEANRHRLRSPMLGELELARGNYAINGGTQRMALFPGTPADPAPGGIHIRAATDGRPAAYWGNGVAGFNKSFSLDDFANGLATTVVVDEIRAGIDPSDSRGVWALGQIGSSVTWGHGMNGDAGRPNDPWKRADDVAGCPELHARYGEQHLIEQNMPCCSYCALGEQAAARSLHPAGVHVLMLDGAARFMSDRVDPGLWHVLHSRETPAERVEGVFDGERQSNSPDAGETVQTDDSAGASGDQDFTNSVGMTLIHIPPGRFLMGQPDEELNAEFELEGTAVPHWVEITRSFSMGMCEVTLGEYQAVMGASALPVSDDAESSAAWQQMPVTEIRWDEAAEFCRRLSALPAEAAAGRRYRLPTEAEWEYACRAGRSEPRIYVRERQPADTSGENAMKEPPLPIVEVRSYLANEFGLFDMRGNAWEWCGDWSHPDYYAASPLRDPAGPPTGYLKVVRGSDWLYVGQRCMLGFRATEPWLRSPFIGFRVVCEREAER